MCITLRPASLSQTIIYAGDAYHPTTMDYIHVLAYQNRASNKDPKPNAMVLPLPAAEPLVKENTIDLTGYDNLLKEVGRPIIDMMSQTLGFEEPKRRSRAITIFKTGSYTVAVAPEAGLVAEALAALPDNLRPQLNREVFKFLGENYPSWPIAICCWDKNIKPEPLMWWYKPLHPKKVFFPALDAHDGKAPNTRKDPKRDHLLLLGSKVRPFGVIHKAKDFGPAAPFIPERIWGREFKGEDFNRDYVVSVPEMRTIQNVRGPQDLHERLDPKIWDLSFDYAKPGQL